MESQLSCHLFIVLGYISAHLSVTASSCFKAAGLSDAVYIVLRSFANAFMSLFATYFNVFLTICTIQRCCSVAGNAVEIASLIPVSPSEQRIRMSPEPTVFQAVKDA